MNLKSKLGYLAFFIFMWTAFSFLYSVTIIYNIKYFITLTELQYTLDTSSLAHYYQSNYQLLEAFLFGLFFGIFHFFIFLIVEQIRRKQMSFLKMTILKTGMYVLAMGIVSLVIYAILMTQYEHVYKDLIEDFSKTQVPAMLIVVIGGSVIAFVLFINFLIEVNYKFGLRHLINLVLGKYYYPQAHEKIFMFIDLKSSTHYAEKLGHLKISSLLQECFFILNLSVEKFDAEIYQYIGDEVVLTWNVPNSNKINHPMALFFDFEKRLLKKKTWFESKYGFFPEFKAGINLGVITIAEVGYTRRELAYHGDAINTASRVQHLCNEYDQPILITQSFYEKAAAFKNFEFHEIDNITLKGKAAPLKIYSALPV